MWTRYLLTGLLLLGSWAFYSPPSVEASCVVETTGSYAEGTSLRDDKCDTGGNKKVTLGGSAAGGLGTATAAAPSLVEGAGAAFSFDLSGNARFTMGTLLSCEDQPNSLCMVSGGVVRLTQILGTGGVPSTATDATTSATTLMTGHKTFIGRITCTGTCVQLQKIYGNWRSATTEGDLVCTISLNASTTDQASCAPTDINYAFYYVTTTLTSGTTPLSGIFVSY